MTFLSTVQTFTPHDWVWVLYLAAVIGGFAALEAYALVYSHDTLSAFVWRVTAGWPPFGWLMGVIVGFLAAHFFWPNQGL